jgi:4-hydroxythreonine-4-phosphate dehydrogenase
MMFHSPTMIGALLTIHVPLSDVGKLLSLSGVVEKLRIVAKTLRNDFGIVKPKIAVLGLNPHAGENGLIGMEDLHVLKKAIDKRAFIKGPFPADAYFGLHKYKEFHCTVACYHDQLLIPFKMLSMSDGVNVTAGLPFVRTSPDHGTGFDIAGKNRADHRSMLNAFRLAYRIAENRSR